MSNFTKITAALWHIAFATGLLGLFAAIAFCWRNGAGHSGIDPFLAIYFFAPVFAFGALGLILTNGRSFPPRAVAVNGFVGIALPFFVTKLNILNQYEDWIDAGMPGRNPYAALPLVGFAIGGLGGSLALAYLTTTREEQDVTAKRPPAGS
jgi:hypothetical protein